MRVRFVKRNDEYINKYKIKTSLIDHNGVLEFRKAPLVDEAYAHLLNMYNSQDKLREVFPLLKICSCKLLDNKEISFEYIEGQTLSAKILNAINKGIEDDIVSMIKIFKKLLYNEENICKFYMTDEFYEIFGDNIELNNVPAFKSSTLDITPNNIIHNEDGYVLIDYEWCVDFPVPIDYILYRMLNYMYINHRELGNIIDFNKAIDILQLNVDISVLEKLENNFLNYIYSSDNSSYKYIINKYQKKFILVTHSLEYIKELEKGISWHEERYKSMEIWQEERYKNMEIWQEERYKNMEIWHEERYKDLENKIQYIKKHPIKYLLKKILKKFNIVLS